MQVAVELLSNLSYEELLIRAVKGVACVNSAKKQELARMFEVTIGEFEYFYLALLSKGEKLPPIVMDGELRSDECRFTK